MVILCVIFGGSSFGTWLSIVSHLHGAGLCFFFYKIRGGGERRDESERGEAEAEMGWVEKWISRMCGPCSQWNMTQPWKGVKLWHRLQCGCSLNTQCLVREADTTGHTVLVWLGSLSEIEGWGFSNRNEFPTALEAKRLRWECLDGQVLVKFCSWWGPGSSLHPHMEEGLRGLLGSLFYKSINHIHGVCTLMTSSPPQGPPLLPPSPWRLGFTMWILKGHQHSAQNNHKLYDSIYKKHPEQANPERWVSGARHWGRGREMGGPQ